MELPSIDPVLLHLGGDRDHIGASIPVVLAPEVLLDTLAASPHPGGPDELPCQGVVALEHRTVQSLGLQHSFTDICCVVTKENSEELMIP